MTLVFSNKSEESLVMTQLRYTIDREVSGDVVFGYMPATKSKFKRYYDFWSDFCIQNAYELVFLDNTLEDTAAADEIKKLNKCNVLLITGGNTYELLRNLRRSGFDKAIKNFHQKDNHVLIGFSAGALVLTPSIKILEEKWEALGDANSVGISDLTGLSLIDIEVLPHFRENDFSNMKRYEKANDTVVVPLGESDFLLV